MIEGLLIRGVATRGTAIGTVMRGTLTPAA
jgi:hypothetical protein